MKYCRLPQAELQLTWPDTVKDWPKVIGFGAMIPVMLVAACRMVRVVELETALLLASPG
jgi:hypothetical protein